LIVVVALAVSPWHASVMAQLASFSHGAAEGGQIKTDRSEIFIFESSAHAQLADSALTVQLQPGDSDLFVFEFDAECSVGGPGDYLSVQARVNGALGPPFGTSFFQPQGGATDLRPCVGAASHTISKSWVIRLSNTTSASQTYTFSIWVRVVGNVNIPPGLAVLDNRIVRYTRYN
jgi:hypothetical protein